MTAGLDRKVALVTGASKGIGAGIARAMATAGADIAVNYVRDKASAQAVVDEAIGQGRRALAVQGDIALPGDIARMFAEAKAAFGNIDIVVNNAGTFTFALLSETTDTRLRAMVDTNLVGTIFVCREALNHFPDSGGAIINIGSMSSLSYSPGATVYAATKAGLTAVTGVLALELGSRNIRVNQINPGAVDTEGARALGAMSAEAKAAYIQKTPLGRVGTPDDIASVAVFLASDDARWITGETIAVSGGRR
jgi:3-oxoacyl-[acyl-carrier protein] reductase